LFRRLLRAACATSISCAGHASVAHATKPKLTSYPDHSVGADQRSVRADAQGDISFDHLVGTRQKGWRDCDPECLRRGRIDH
jgi:hypothetical protein